MPAESIHQNYTLSRRDFLRGLASFVGVSFVQFGGFGAGILIGNARTKFTWDKSTFASRINDKFSVDFGAAGAHALHLLQVHDQDSKKYYQPGQVASALTDTCYVLVFNGPRNNSATQGTYQFSHSELGGFPLFIVPGSLDENGQRYVAVINNLNAALSSRN